MESLSGKIVIVTGGTRGIGRAIAEQLLREGASVAICGRTQESTRSAVSQMKPLGKVFGHAADIADAAQVSNFFRAVDGEFGGLDILVNNAGRGVFRKVGEMTADDWQQNIGLNLTGAFYCCREALSRFGKREGFIVNISSLAGKNPFSTGAAYNASKAGLNLFSEAMMLDHRYDNLRVCSIMPGSVNTEFGSGPFDHSGDGGWMIQAEDVAEVVSLVLRMPARTMVSAVEIRPSRPKKK